MATKKASSSRIRIFESAKELDEPQEAKISGEVPSWLSGTLVRVGPGKFELGSSSYKHWFDGQALLHRFEIKNQQVTYFNKFVRSQSYTEGLKHGHVCMNEFGTVALPDPCKNIFSRYFSYYWSDGDVVTDNPVVNIVEIKGKTYATSEIPVITQIDPSTLEVIGNASYSKDFPGDAKLSTLLAHPHVAADGTVFNISASFGRHSKWVMTEIPPKSNNPVEKPFDGGKAICSISPYSNLAYMHSFGMTDNFFIVVENPLLLSITKLLLRSIVGYSYADALYWDPDQFSIFHVIERSSGSRVGRFTSQPFFCFHHINAFEDEESGNIVVDLCGYKDATIVQELYLQHLRSGKPVSRSDVRRYKLPLGELREPQRTKLLSKDAEGLDHEVLFSGLELPQFNYGCFNGKPYRYVYGVGSSTPETFQDQLVKVDLTSREFQIWKEPGKYPSEPVFVPAPRPETEDDGLVLSAVIDVENNTTFLLVLDARDFKEIAIAVVPGATPYPLHGRFLNNK